MASLRSLEYYKDNMYVTKIDDIDYAVKPMNCPGSMLVYKTKMYSYRDLPLRMAELGSFIDMNYRELFMD